MKILYVHERFGALAGAEANAHITATELGQRGHQLGLLHGPSTGKNEAAWQATFPFCAPLGSGDNAAAVSRAVADFQPDAVYVHKMADLSVIQTLVSSGIPLLRMVHDHDIYCMRSYKYNYFTRKICTRVASPYCIFPCLASVVKNSGDRVNRRAAQCDRPPIIVRMRSVTVLSSASISASGRGGWKT